MSIVSTRFEGAMAVITIDNPPVNMGNAAMRTALLEAVRGLAGRAELTGAVFVSAGKHFYAGSDISEFDLPLAEPQLPAVIAAIEDLPIPVVAAITGLALGGGFEFALGCDGRVGDSSAKVGFPEVNLGFLPGAGGTVRTGRLLGVPAAIELVTSARQLSASEALELGLIDRVVDSADELLPAAIALAESLGGKRILRDLPVPESDAAEVDRAVEAIPRRSRPNVFRAAAMVRRAAELPGPEALVAERRLFHELRTSEEASNLRYLFFAKRAAAKDLRTSVPAARVSRVGIIGAGTMGASLAELFAGRRFDTVVYDADAAAAERATSSIEGARAASSLADLADADIVVEAVFEDMAVKRDVLAAVEAQVRPDAIIVSNTSYLDLDEMASGLRRPERFAGLHFFNPARRNPLVEFIPVGATDDTTRSTLDVFVGRLGKVPIRAGNADGFVANRVYADYRLQAEFLVEDGADPSEVDAALTRFGMAMGPFAVADLSGLDIAWSRRKRLAANRDPRLRYVPIADILCEANRFGRKTGAGWYSYADGERHGLPDPWVDAVIVDVRAQKGIAPRAIDDDEIVDRVVGSMVCAAVALVETGVAARASDIDVALTEGFAFPKHTGGPLRLMATWPEDRVIRSLARTHASDPVAFEVAAPASGGVVPARVATVLDTVLPNQTAG